MMFVPATLKTDLPDEQYLAPEEKPARLRSGSASDVIQRILRDHPRGLTSAELRAELARQEPTASSLIGSSSNYLYNVLKRLIDTRTLVRTNEAYRLRR